MKDKLKEFKNKAPFYLEDLVDIVNGVFRDDSLFLSGYGAGSRPLTPRTIRYYISSGVVAKPAGYEGTKAVFTYRHVLQLLAVRRLKERKLTLANIRILVNKLDNGGLEKLVTEEEMSLGEWLDTIIEEGRQLSREFSYPMESGPLESPPIWRSRNLARRWHYEDRLKKSFVDFWRDGLLEESWRRIQVEPGLELHVARWFSRTGLDLEEVLERIREILKSRVFNK